MLFDVLSMPLGWSAVDAHMSSAAGESAFAVFVFLRPLSCMHGMTVLEPSASMAGVRANVRDDIFGVVCGGGGCVCVCVCKYYVFFAC